MHSKVVQNGLPQAEPKVTPETVQVAKSDVSNLSEADIMKAVKKQQRMIKNRYVYGILLYII